MPAPSSYRSSPRSSLGFALLAQARLTLDSTSRGKGLLWNVVKIFFSPPGPALRSARGSPHEGAWSEPDLLPQLGTSCWTVPADDTMNRRRGTHVLSCSLWTARAVHHPAGLTRRR